MIIIIVLHDFLYSNEKKYAQWVGGKMSRIWEELEN